MLVTTAIGAGAGCRSEVAVPVADDDGRSSGPVAGGDATTSSPSDAVASGAVSDATRPAAAPDRLTRGSSADVMSAAAESDVASMRTRPLRWSENSGDPTGPIGYVVVEPDDAVATTPVLIALHGMGDTAEAFSRFIRRLGVRARVIVGRGPLPWGQVGGRQWFELDAEPESKSRQIHQRARDLTVLADKLALKYPEAGKPALLGFSQGAAVVLQALVDAPDRWRSVAGLSGFIAGTELAQTPKTVVPVLLSAGSKDDIVPMQRSWEAAAGLERVGHKDVRRLEFDGPHQIPREVVDAVRAFFIETLGVEP